MNKPLSRKIQEQFCPHCGASIQSEWIRPVGQTKFTNEFRRFTCSHSICFHGLTKKLTVNVECLNSPENKKGKKF